MRSRPCSAAPDRPRMAPIASASSVRGRRISRTITCDTSLPPPNSASTTVSGDSRTGPMPSEISTSRTTRAASAAVSADPPARGILVGHGDGLNTHRSSSKRFARTGTGVQAQRAHAAKIAHSSSEDRSAPVAGLTPTLTNFYHSFRRFPFGDQKGMRCGEIPQFRGCPRNCKRQILRHMPLGISVLGRRRRVTTREPGDLPSAVVTREDVGRGVQTLASLGSRKRDGETWFAVTCH